MAQKIKMMNKKTGKEVILTRKPDVKPIRQTKTQRYV